MSWQSGKIFPFTFVDSDRIAILHLKAEGTDLLNLSNDGRVSHKLLMKQVP